MSWVVLSAFERLARIISNGWVLFYTQKAAQSRLLVGLALQVSLI